MSVVSIHSDMKNRIIRNSNQDVKYFINKYNLLTYGQLTEENLLLLHKENATLFYDVVRIFGFLGVRFTGKLEQFSALDLNQGSFLYYEENETDEMHNTDVAFTYKIERFLSPFMTSYGLQTIADFSGLHLPTLRNHLEKLNFASWYQPLIEELLEQHFIIVSKLDEYKPIVMDSVLSSESTSNAKAQPKIVYFDDLMITIPPNIQSRKIEGVFSSSLLRNVNCLISDGFTTYGQLPERLADYFRTKFQIGVGKINRFKLELLKNLEEDGNHTTPLATKIDSETRVQQERPIHVPAILFNKRIDLFNSVITKYTLYPEIAERLTQLGISKWGELTGYTKSELLERLSKKGTRMNRLYHMFETLEINLNGEESETPLEVLWERFCSDMSAITKNNNPYSEMLDEGVWDVLCRRINKGPLGRERKLQGIAVEKGVTRERIRQLELKGFQLFMFRHMPLIYTIYEAVKGKHKLVKIEEILNVQIKLNEAGESVLASLIKKCDLGIAYSLTSHAFLEGEQTLIQEEIDEFVTYLLSKRRWYYPNRLWEKVNDFFENNPTTNIRPEYVKEQIIPSLFLVYDSIYFVTDGTKRDLTFAVFEAFFPYGLAIIKDSKQFTDKVLSVYPDKFVGNDDRSIYSSLLRNEEDVLIWDNGYYIPRSSIQVSHEDIEPMMAWTVQLLKNNQSPQIRLTRTLWHFQEDLARISITNAYSLYTCFRLYGQEYFDYIKAPRICLKGGLEAARQPLSQMFQEYMKNQKRKVSRKEIFDLFKGQMGWQSYHIEQRFGDQIIRAGVEEYIHIDNLQVSEKGLEAVKNWLARKLESVDTVVSIKIVNRAIMKMAGVDSYQILYNLFEREYPDVFSFYIYPKLGLFDPSEQEEASIRRSRMALLENHILSGNKVFYRSELESYFQSIGWNNFICNSDNLIIYEFKNDMALAFVHTATIGWTEQKQTSFFAVIDEVFDTYHAQGQVYLDMDAVFLQTDIESRLPELDNHVAWTSDLIISLLKPEERFEILGFVGRIIIRDDNPVGIANDQDLIHYVLIKDFGGATSMGKMEKRLQDINLINRNMRKIHFNDEADEEMPYVTTPSLEIMTQELYSLQKRG